MSSNNKILGFAFQMTLLSGLHLHTVCHFAPIKAAGGAIENCSQLETWLKM